MKHNKLYLMVIFISLVLLISLPSYASKSKAATEKEIKTVIDIMKSHSQKDMQKAAFIFKRHKMTTERFSIIVSDIMMVAPLVYSTKLNKTKKIHGVKITKGGDILSKAVKSSGMLAGDYFKKHKRGGKKAQVKVFKLVKKYYKPLNKYLFPRVHTDVKK